MKKKIDVALVYSSLFIFTSLTPIAKSADHPLITAYPGSVINKHTVKEYDEYELPLGQIKGGQFTKTQRLEGKITLLDYSYPVNRSTLEVFRNYEESLKKGGFEILFHCFQRECGNGSTNTKGLSIFQSPLAFGEMRYLAAKLARDQGDVYLALHIKAGSNHDRHTYLAVIESKPMDKGLVTVNAEALANEIAQSGHASVYGILFDTDSATIKPQSTPALLEISKLMKQKSALKLFVVGHTDNVGTLEHNRDLSNRRASAIFNALTSQFGVAPARLSAHGVGPLAPISSNSTDQGRAKNRRVELVEQ